MYICMHVSYLQKPQENIGFSGTRVSGGCEPSDAGAGNCITKLFQSALKS